MSITLPNLEKFLSLLHEVQRVKRMSRRPGETEQTNTAEHTFEVALTSWYVACLSGRNLNVEKLLIYALVHDLVEAYAGDTPIFDTEKIKDKEKREHGALLRIQNEFSELPKLAETIEAYERREDEESRFVYAIDKLIDPLNFSLEEGTTIWKEKSISNQQMRNYKDDKIAIDRTVQDLWQQLTAKLDSNSGHFFP